MLLSYRNDISYIAMVYHTVAIPYSFKFPRSNIFCEFHDDQKFFVTKLFKQELKYMQDLTLYHHK